MIHQNGKMQPTKARFGATPELCPIVYDETADSVISLQLSRRDYEIVSFLDRRLLDNSYPTFNFSWRALEEASIGGGEGLDYIFHTGHVGSTLLSRLLGLSPRVFALREPALLRQLAELHGGLAATACPWSPPDWESRLSTLLALWSRTWAPQQRVLLKATSSVSEIAEALLSRPAAARAILLSVRPEVYLATILGGPASRIELGQMAPARLQRLHRRLGQTVWRLDQLSEGEQAAMSWTCEMAGLVAAGDRHQEVCVWLNFDDLLADPATVLTAMLIHLHGSAPTEVVANMAASPYFQRYSKAPEYGYDAALRVQVLDQARRDHGEELRRGMAWLAKAARDHPLIQTLLDQPLKAIPI
jgi:hypothetical protein